MCWPPIQGGDSATGWTQFAFSHLKIVSKSWSKAGLLCSVSASPEMLATPIPDLYWQCSWRCAASVPSINDRIHLIAQRFLVQPRLDLLFWNQIWLVSNRLQCLTNVSTPKPHDFPLYYVWEQTSRSTPLHENWVFIIKAAGAKRIVNHCPP